MAGRHFDRSDRGKGQERSRVTRFYLERSSSRPINSSFFEAISWISAQNCNLYRSSSKAVFSGAEEMAPCENKLK